MKLTEVFQFVKEAPKMTRRGFMGGAAAAAATGPGGVGAAGGKQAAVDKFNQSKQGYDHFSKDFPSFDNFVRSYLGKYFGKNWEKEIDTAYGPGSVKEMIKNCWDGHWTDSETINQVGFAYDIVQRGDVSHYGHLTNPGPQYTDGEERTERPMSAKDFD